MIRGVICGAWSQQRFRNDHAPPIIILHLPYPSPLIPPPHPLLTHHPLPPPPRPNRHPHPTPPHPPGDESTANAKLLDVLRQVQCFGLALMRLDIRQESTR
jgi:hypothetical protein